MSLLYLLLAFNDARPPSAIAARLKAATRKKQIRIANVFMAQLLTTNLAFLEIHSTK